MLLMIQHLVKNMLGLKIAMLIQHLVEILLGLKIVMFHCDGGGEFTSLKFLSHLTSCGIKVDLLSIYALTKWSC